MNLTLSDFWKARKTTSEPIPHVKKVQNPTVIFRFEKGRYEAGDFMSVYTDTEMKGNKMRHKKRSYEDQRRFDQQQDYDYYHTRQYKLKLNRETDEDIINWIEKKMRWNSGTSFQGEIKRLIRQEIGKESDA